ncbi:PT domain-containing protein [Nocardioides sp. AE5]|uniref:PT domain-containing protein n=1 Tax=Nocardioides sp. AE5 TaxID=2962573 RepID=UPI002881EA95|nr:PT domain-containing protein [Nocardioides sp. AE5]MDT0202326.1 PT domain-containing protein [Nocardioides sp. AE5]
MRTKRLSLIAASLVLLGGMTAACGDNDDEKAGESTSTPAGGESSDAPTDEPTDDPTDEPTDEPTDDPTDNGDGISVDEFCQNAIKAGQAEVSDDFAAAQEEWKKFYAAGAPSDIDPESAEGFKWYHDLITADGTQQELQQKYAADTEGQKVFAAFQAYVGTTCEAYAG